MSLTLRQYQKDAIQSILADWAKHDAVLAVLATGAGKTILFLSLLLDHILSGVDTKERGLILAHRQELIQQPVDRIAQFWPQWGEHVGIVMADQDQCDRQLTVATVQTISRPERMAKLLSNGAIDYAIVDECHHSTSKTYLEIIEALRQANQHVKLLGVTATPLRTDKDGLSKVFKRVSAKYGIKELVKLGHLVPFKALAVQTRISLSGVKSAEGDYIQSQLADAWECDNLFDLVIESHQRWADDRPTMCFCVSVEGAHKLAQKFRDAGIPAGAADGTTSREDRAAVIRAFKAGDIKVLANCQLWTEGLDLPQIACVHMIRPTKSDLVYVQAIGRGLRTYPAKDDCVAEGQRVLTDHGLIPIERVTRAMKVWDGGSFVMHDGAMPRGEQEVINYAGLIATPDHRVWTKYGWRRFGECAALGIPIACTGDGAKPLREIDGYRRNAATEEWPAGAGKQNRSLAFTDTLHDLWRGGVAFADQSSQGDSGVPRLRPPETGSEVALSAGAASTTTVHQLQRQELWSIWGEGYRVSVRVAAGNGALDTAESWATSRYANRPNRQRRPLRSGQFAIRQRSPKHGEQQNAEGQRAVPCLSVGACRCEVRGWHVAPSSPARTDLCPDSRTVLPSFGQTKRRVWDILNAGPLHRFTAEGLLVSNCLILDYAPEDARNVIMAGDLLGKPRKQKEAEEKAARSGVLSAFSYTGEGNGIDGDPDELIIRQLDYLSTSPYTWYYDDGVSTLGLGQQEGVQQNLAILRSNGGFDLLLLSRGKGDWRWQIERLAYDDDYELVAEIGADYAEAQGAPVLIGKGKSWQGNIVSDAQVGMLVKLGVPRDKARIMDRGLASRLITNLMTHKGLRQAGWLVKEGC